MVEGMEPGTALEGEAALLVQSASRCYVEQCPRAQLKEFVEVNIGIETYFIIVNSRYFCLRFGLAIAINNFILK